MGNNNNRKPQRLSIEKIDHLTDMSKDELIAVWDNSVRSSHHFLSEEDLAYYRSRIMHTYIHAVELYVIRQSHVVAFMGLSDEMVEMLFVLPSEKGKGGWLFIARLCSCKKAYP